MKRTAKNQFVPFINYTTVIQVTGSCNVYFFKNIVYILQENRSLFTTLCEPPYSVMNRKMFDILYKDGCDSLNEADLEIYLLFVFIRFAIFKTVTQV